MTSPPIPQSEFQADLQAAHAHFQLRDYDRDAAHRQYDLDHAHAIARWYLSEAEPVAGQQPSEAAAALYCALADVVLEQFDYLTRVVGIRVSFTVDDPYGSSAELIESVHSTGELRVFKTRPGAHQLWTAFDNDLFRAVHDLFGHATWNNSFGPKGEDAAYRSHAATIPYPLLPALAAETRGQNAAFNYGPGIDGRPRKTFAKQSWLPAPNWVTYWNI